MTEARDIAKFNADRLAFDDSNVGFTAADIQAAVEALDTNKAAAGHTHANATQASDGFMSSTDKTKLDGISEEELDYEGDWDASTGSYPANPNRGDWYRVSVTGKGQDENDDLSSLDPDGDNTDEWSLGTNWSHDTANNKITHATGSVAWLTRDIEGLTTNIEYEIDVEVGDRTAGFLTVDVDGSSIVTQTNGTASVRFVATNTTARLTIKPTTGFDGSILSVTRNTHYESGDNAVYNGSGWDKIRNAPRPIAGVEKYPKTQRAGYIWPYYIFPSYFGDEDSDGTSNLSDDDWSFIADVVEPLRQHSALQKIVIINPSSGPGSSTDENYTHAIDHLHDADALVIGYLLSGFGNRAIADVKADIDAYRLLYPRLDGIFVDEFTNANDDAYLEFYKEIRRYAHKRGLSLVVGNPGTATHRRYWEEDAADILVIYESGTAPSADDLRGPEWLDSSMRYVERYRKAALVYGQATFDPALVDLLAEYVHWSFVTDDDGSNPWDTIPSYVTETLERLEAPTAFNNHVGSGGSEHAAATTNTAGFLSASDKTKIDTLVSGAQVVNQGATPSIQANTRANQPAAGTAGRIYVVTDEDLIERDDGAQWVKIADTGDLSGPASSTDNALARWDGTGGGTLQNSGWTLNDSDELNAGDKPAYNSPARENVIGSTANNQSLDLSAYNYFELEPTGNIEIDFTNLSANGRSGAVVKLTGGGDHTITWKAGGATGNVKWDGGSAPSLSTGTDYDLIVAWQTASGTLALKRGMKAPA